MQTLNTQDIKNTRQSETQPDIQPQGIRTKRALIPGINDLQTTHPEVAALWDEERNGALTPCQLLSGSNKKVWWRCEKGHAWQAAPYSLTISGTRCPYCSGQKVIPGENDLVTRYPEIATLWDSEHNDISPNEIMPTSKKKYWWRCKEGHYWQATASSLTLLKTGCPYCSGRRKIPGKTDLATRYPEIAALWATDRNEMDLSTVAPSSCKSAWWRCEKGHYWRAQIHSVTSGKSHCPYCAGRFRRYREEVL